ncbi:hypothetical protein BSKO_02967 [Bryopsis sp. KO-2023]|nr:hypothetical protein BSKO_02967 [Bryopsis sp. KO-2023]
MIVGVSSRVATTTFVGGSTTTRLNTECAKRVQHKATKHHRKTRPKKSNPYDKNKKPAEYPPLPAPPPQVVVLSEPAPSE